MSFRLHSPDPLDVGLGESTPDAVVCPVSVLSASDDFFLSLSESDLFF